MSLTRSILLRTVGDASLMAHCEGVDSLAVPIHATAGGGTPTWGHEPAGYTRLAEHNFEVDPVTGTGYVYPGGAWNLSTAWGGTNVTVTDATIPAGYGPKALEVIYRGPHPEWNPPYPGLGPGASPGVNLWVDWRNATGHARGCSDIYCRWLTKIGSPTLGMEMPTSQAKFWGYMSAYTTINTNQNVISCRAWPNTAAQRLGADAPLSAPFAALLTRCYYPWDQIQGEEWVESWSTTDWTFGYWHWLEVLMNANTLDGAGHPIRNGRLRCWVDGRLCVDRTNLVMWNPNGPWFKDSGDPRTDGCLGIGDSTYYPAGGMGFYRWHYDPIWGGGGPNRKTRDDVLRMAHVYISGLFR